LVEIGCDLVDRAEQRSALVQGPGSDVAVHLKHDRQRVGLTVRHPRSHLAVRLPADYFHTATGLGYAITIHTAQGVSAESRQQLYAMLTRGRHGKHLYLQVVGDDDPHTVIRPDTVAPRTPSELLEQILARADATTSATTLLRELDAPGVQLFQAVQRYTDVLYLAAEQLLGPQTVAELDQADQYIPGLTTEPAWPTLRAQLLALGAETGQHPSCTYRHPPADATSEAQTTSPPSSTGASQRSRLSSEHRPHRRNRSVARRQRHQLSRPATLVDGQGVQAV
jgi:hypothetical protein